MEGTKMTKESNIKVVKQGGGNAVYCLGLLGALVYCVGQVDGFWNIIGAILKAFIWPAFLVYDLLKYIAA